MSSTKHHLMIQSTSAINKCSYSVGVISTHVRTSERLGTGHFESAIAHVFVIRVHKCNDCHQHYTGWDEDGCVPFDNCEGDGQTIYTDHKNQRGYWASKSGRKECHRLLQHSYGGCIDRFVYPSNADHSTSIDVECTW